MTNPRDLVRHVRREMTTTGELVVLALRLGSVELAVHFAQHGLRAARLLGLYVEEA
jgi:hypothetical protein